MQVWRNGASGSLPNGQWKALADFGVNQPFECPPNRTYERPELAGPGPTLT
ncbi:hypothetical protein PAMC26510_05540 [Caballeronia sordidicola]|uniref:Uncharacterized protein n=1 Tax=Caballeronia sordidicola TaxID=196367 RepID=A0A242N8K6_CABSO|nr:hypothetical protein PAMC26510_05540 [Caballeronia sordidicola]